MASRLESRRLEQNRMSARLESNRLESGRLDNQREDARVDQARQATERARIERMNLNSAGLRFGLPPMRPDTPTSAPTAGQALGRLALLGGLAALVGMGLAAMAKNADSPPEAGESPPPAPGGAANSGS